MKIARFLAACFGALFLAALGAQPTLAANPLTLTSATFDASGQKFGTGALSGGYGSAGAAITAYPFTIEGYGKTTSSSGFGMIAALNGNIWVGVLNGQAQAANLTTTVMVNDGQYHHFAAVYTSSTTGYLYIDGVLASSGAGTGNDLGSPASLPIVVGAYTNGGQFAWQGDVDEVRFSSTARYSGNFTPPSAAFTTDASTVALYHLDANGTDASAGGVPAGNTIAANDASFSYSPGNWNVSSTAATTINGGAYVNVGFTGTSCTLNFDVSKMVVSAQSQVEYQIDGLAPVRAALASGTIPCSLPADTATLTKHTLEVAVKATTEFQSPPQSGQRWSPSTGPNTAVVFTGLTLDVGATVYALAKPAGTDLYLGDSITEGYLATPASGATDVAQSDSLLGWAYQQRRLQGRSVGVIGFGGQGWASGGVGGVPAFTTTLANVYSGVPRLFTGVDRIFINEGENGGANASDVTAALNTLLAAVPSTTRIFVLRPFSGNGAAGIQAGIAASSNPSRITYLDTTGIYANQDGQHPNGVTNTASVAPAVAALIQSVTTTTTTVIKPPFRLGFH